jgi:hypothetical protein
MPLLNLCRVVRPVRDRVGKDPAFFGRHSLRAQLLGLRQQVRLAFVKNADMVRENKAQSEAS